MANTSQTLHIAALTNPTESGRLEELLSHSPHLLRCFPDFERLVAYLNTSAGVHVVLLDIDAELSEEQVLELASDHPRATLFCLSSRRTHPEFKKSIRDVFFACITKPLRKEELLFFLGSIHTPTNM